MTESEWQQCTEPRRMLEFLRTIGGGTDRKLRLFAAACCRRVWNLLPNKYSRKSLTVAERYADGEVSADKLGFAWGDARRAAQVATRQARELVESAPLWAVARLCEADVGVAVAAAEWAALGEASPGERTGLSEVRTRQILLLRDIFGPLPYFPVTVDPLLIKWNDCRIVKLAQAAYHERLLPSGCLDQQSLAVLADALEDASCANEDILGHCRQQGAVHVRGCWVIDLLLNKA